MFKNHQQFEEKGFECLEMGLSPNPTAHMNSFQSCLVHPDSRYYT